MESLWCHMCSEKSHPPCNLHPVTTEMELHLFVRCSVIVPSSYGRYVKFETPNDVHFQIKILCCDSGWFHISQVQDEHSSPDELSFQETYGAIKGHAWCHHTRLIIAFQAGEPL